MRKSRFTESQIVAILKEADAGMKVGGEGGIDSGPSMAPRPSGALRAPKSAVLPIFRTAEPNPRPPHQQTPKAGFSTGLWCLAVDAVHYEPVSAKFPVNREKYRDFRCILTGTT